MRYIFILLILLAGCEEDVTPHKRDYPRIETISATVGSNGVTFRGKFVAEGKSPVLDHGFTWSTRFPDKDNSPTLSLGRASAIGVFTAVLSSPVQRGVTYTVRAYAVTSDYEVYGQDMTFVVR